MFGATSIVKNSDEEKWVYSGYGIAFDGEGEWSFGNDYDRNVITLESIIVHHSILIISIIIFSVR